MANDNTTNNATTAQDTTVNTTVKNTVKNTVKKFVLKFVDFNTARPGVTCAAENFASVLHSDNYSAKQAKTALISHFISAQNEIARENNQPSPIWSYNMTTKSNTTTTAVYAAPKINFIPIKGDLETVQSALTQAKVCASFFDSQIEKHLESVGVKTTRSNVRAYRKSYISQISKMLIEEILNKSSTAYVTRWFDRVNGNSYFSIHLSSGQFELNIPLSYGYDNAENLVVRALRLQPRTVSARAVLEELGIAVVDLGYRTKGELYKAAFHI